MGTLKNHLSLVGWLIGFAINFFITFAFEYQDTFEHTFASGVGRVVGFAVVAFMLVRVIALFKGSQFIDTYLPWVFVVLSVLIR